MPEMPEVEWVVRRLSQVLPGSEIRSVTVLCERTIRPTSPQGLRHALAGTRIQGVGRRGKYITLELTGPTGAPSLKIMAHLGMTGRMDVVSTGQAHPRHTVLILDLGARQFLFEDPRKFGRFTLDTSPLLDLGPEPLSDYFTSEVLSRALNGSRQPVKSFLLDQARIAGVGNIYASEALFRSGIHPARIAATLSPDEAARLHRSIRDVLNGAIAAAEAGDAGTQFYYGSGDQPSAGSPPRFLIYDREGDPCQKCAAPIRRAVQSGRSSYFCPTCQPLRRPAKHH